MESYWQDIKAALTSLGCLDKVALNPGASALELDALEEHLDVRLPIALREFLSIHNGQDKAGVGMVSASLLLSTAGIKQCWDSWREIDEDDMNEDCADSMESEPEGFIKPMYTNRKWIPLTKDGGGNHIGIDFDPDEQGRVGQIIVFGSDEDTKRLIASDFSEFITKLINSLKNAEWDDGYIDSEI